MAITRALDDPTLAGAGGTWLKYDTALGTIRSTTESATSLKNNVSNPCCCISPAVLISPKGFPTRPRLRETIHLWVIHSRGGEVSSSHHVPHHAHYSYIHTA